MRAFLVALVLALLAPLCTAQVRAGYAVSSNPNYTMPAGKIKINPASIPDPRPGYSGFYAQDVPCIGTIAACVGTSVDYTIIDGGGAMRVNCAPSHYSYDDPIVWAGRPGMTHLHEFFGNNTTSGLSNLFLQATVGTSTCDGGTANRTGYWVPALVYHCPAPDITGCTFSRDGEVQLSQSTGNGSNLVYYKSGEPDNWPDNQTAGLRWPPQGLVMIAGSASSTALQTDGHFSWNCYDATVAGGSNPAGAGGTGVGGAGYVGRLPTYEESTRFNTCHEQNMFVAFPNCLNDSLSIDSPDHKSHLVYRTGSMPAHPTFSACDTTGFTVPIPNISVNVHYIVSDLHDYDYLRVSSDPPEQYGVTQTSADASHIKLASSEPGTANWYLYGMLFIGGVGHQVTAWDEVNKIATVIAPFGSTPAAGTAYAIRQPGGITMHADWANGWDQTTVVTSGRTITDIILLKCLWPDVNCGTDDLSDANTAHDRTVDPNNIWWYVMRAFPR